MLQRTALCVGINRYQNFPQASLSGCVQDAQDMASLLKDMLGFEASNICLMTDESATKANILRELKRMVEGALAKKYNHLVFSFAGHGTQVPDLNLDEFDRADEVFCPHDLAATSGRWDRDHLIVDDEFHDLFVLLPPTVILEVYLDTSHSGAGLRAADLLLDRRPRYLPPPSVEAFREIEYRRARSAHIKLMEKGLSHHILWTACKEGQVAVDTFIQDSWHGAFTYHFCREARASANHLSRAKILAKVRSYLSHAHFTQTPQLDCEAITRHAALKALEVPPSVAPLPTEMPT